MEHAWCETKLAQNTFDWNRTGMDDYQSEIKLALKHDWHNI